MERKAIIIMNDMRGSAENSTEIDQGFANRQAAIDYINQYKVEPYQDEASTDFYGNKHGYSKTFAKGSPLEWLNPLSSDEMQGQSRFEHGIIEIELQTIQRWVRVS